MIAVQRAVSRDEAVRQVLSEHLEEQERRGEDDRLTHISTVLRYPGPPRWRLDPRIAWPTPRTLRLRLPAGVLARARSVSLLLPGQSPRAHHDYQGRPVTDAIMTAIAVQEPFTDEFLDDMLPLLRHRSALGLWQLAVAATSTEPENAVQDAAAAARSEVGASSTALPADEQALRRRLMLVAERLEEDISWHGHVRFQVAAAIARDRLVGAAAADFEQVLYEQRAEWEELRQDLRLGGAARSQYWEGLGGYDWSGRGAAAVWRAQRGVEVQDFEEWLFNLDRTKPVERPIVPPGWRIRVPANWRAIPLTAQQVTEPFASWVDAGRMLVVPFGNGRALWPTVPCADAHGRAPVPGIEPILAVAMPLRPEQLIGFVEAMLVNWNPASNEDVSEEDDDGIRLRLPADQAYRFGLIDADERRAAMADARAATLNAMVAIIDGLPDNKLYHRPALQAAYGNTAQFRRVAARVGVKFHATRAMWAWPGRSVVDEISSGAAADILAWLAHWAYKSHARTLQISMEQAWHDAFDHRPAEWWIAGLGRSPQPRHMSL